MASLSDRPISDIVEGFAFAAGASRRYRARLEPSTSTGAVALFDAETDATLASARASDVVREPRMARMPSVARLPSGWRFETEDHDGLDALVGSSSGAHRHRWERFGPHLIVVVIAVAPVPILVATLGVSPLVP